MDNSPNSPNFWTEAKTGEIMNDAKNQIFVSALRESVFCCLLPTRPRIALASLGLRHAILETAYKVTEAKSETQSPQVLMNK